ncbi:hypothetical protein CGCSCA4_v002418 [Colletotrichum siamense]|uniref:Uncharacterized protein n=1 Tax=Colletotrichum siamense TaxID=690259 RepID=A0A9P5EZL1_COLSI|nr:hypothetical protein CGCSCA4_v002418 [Colletotrichum siamense]KAF4863837.1 hypothetical protein CGCSCA2_v002553 [Colletotrichum siamense]
MSQSDMQMVPMEPITVICPARDILMSIRDGKSIRKLQINSRSLSTVYWPFPAIMGQPLIYQRTEGPATVIAHVNMSSTATTTMLTTSISPYRAFTIKMSFNRHPFRSSDSTT